MMWLTRLLVPAMLALPLVSCRAPTEIRVEVTTSDVDCKNLTTIIAVGAIDGVETRHPATTTLSCSGGRVGALVIVPSGDDNAEVAFRVVAAQGKDPDTCGPGYAGCIVARRALRFLPHTSLTVSVPLRQSCFGKACAGGGDFSTCVDGQCVAAAISDPGRCTGAGCDESSLGGAEGDAGAPDATTTDEGDASKVDEAGTARGTWRPMASSSTIGFPARASARAVWTGTKMLVWGGALDSSYGGDGASYDPVTDTWSMLPSSQLQGRADHTMIWTGTEAIVWGGQIKDIDGARYDPVKGFWRLLEPVPAGFKGRSRHTAVWTGTEMIVWGGDDDVASLADGAAYTPSTGKWRVIAQSPLSERNSHGAVWDGTRMIIFGGGGCGNACGDVAAYEPMTDKWTTIAPPPPVLDARNHPQALATGPTLSLATFYGGGSRFLDPGRVTGATYDGTKDAWTVIDGLGAPVLPDPGRYNPAAWWGDGRMWIWGGYATNSGSMARDEGAVYDPATRTWSPMPAGGPSKRALAVVVWTGTEAIIWSGEPFDNAPLLDDGKRFRP
jgi:hypothetical protein